MNLCNYNNRTFMNDSHDHSYFYFFLILKHRSYWEVNRPRGISHVLSNIQLAFPAVHIPFTSTTSSVPMPFWKVKSKLVGKVIAILRLRPTIDTEEPRHLGATNGQSFAGHYHSNLHPPSRQPLISMIHSTSAHVDPTSYLDTSSGLSDSTSSSNDLVHQAHNHQWYVTAFSH